MSTLTKVLIVLLSLSTIFLSGTMVTFVASSSNYKAVVDDLKEKIAGLEDETATYDERFMKKAVQAEQERKALQARIQDLQNQRTELAISERAAKNERDQLQLKLNANLTAMESFDTTIANLEKSRDQAQAELTKNLALVTKLKAQLNASDAVDAESSVIIRKLRATVMNLTEQNNSLEAKIASLAQGKNVDIEEPVTTIPDTANAAATVLPTNAKLKGLVSGMNPKLDLVTISLGSADGVTKGTLFYVTRGSEFICSIKITYVDTNKSAGVIELLSQNKEMPKTGDTVTNRL